LRIRGDENLPECNLAEPFYFEPEYASQNSSKSVSKSSNAFSNIDTNNNKKYKETPLVITRFFEASALPKSGPSRSIPDLSGPFRTEIKIPESTPLPHA